MPDPYWTTVGNLYTACRSMPDPFWTAANNLYTVTGTTTYTTDPFWAQTAGATSSVNQRVWRQWNSPSLVQGGVGTVAPRTARDDLVARNRSRAYELRKRVADRRAEALLRENLTDEQREEYDRLQRFHVVVDGKTYRIRRGWAGNIDLIEDDKPVERWCVHPRSTIPTPDSLLSQKLMLESGQAAELRRIANVEYLPGAVHGQRQHRQQIVA